MKSGYRGTIVDRAFDGGPGPEEIRTYQVYLIQERHLAPSSLEIAVCALRFSITSR